MLNSFRCFAPPVGLEPTTTRLTAECSTYWANEEYKQNIQRRRKDCFYQLYLKLAMIKIAIIILKLSKLIIALINLIFLRAGVYFLRTLLYITYLLYILLFIYVSFSFTLYIKLTKSRLEFNHGYLSVHARCFLSLDFHTIISYVNGTFGGASPIRTEDPSVMSRLH